jgi:protoporphyrin/coproporphyrin ferrochelatase
VSEVYDAILVVSFGGPEGPDDVMPFLENVLRGRNVPRERMLEVAEHYNRFDGISPINDQCRQLISALRQELDAHQIDLPVYWGNRNWHPMLSDTMQEMKRDGIKRALAFVTAAYSSYSSCRQYRENIMAAQDSAADGAPVVDKIRVFYNHPDFVAVCGECVRDAVNQIPRDRQPAIHVAFTAHSIPESMASACDYVQQLTESCRLVSEAASIAPDHWKLVFQSRSGPPQVSWLAPDINDHLRDLKLKDVKDVVVMPIGFLSDHMEVMYDLDDEAQETCREIGLKMVRSATVGTHPRFVGMIRKLISERLGGNNRKALGRFPPNHDVCPLDCCPAPARRPN